MRLRWLREWALGFAILITLFVAYLLHTPVAA
jgi:hypothetical protein